MRNRIIYSLAALVLMTACYDGGEQLSPGSVETKAPILGSAEGATDGQILVKFKPAMGDAIDNVGAQSMTRSGVQSIDSHLELFAVDGFKRVFPVDSRREDITRESGLDLWYVINFDNSHSLVEVAQKLASMEGVDKVEYLHTMSYSKRNPSIPLTNQKVLNIESAPLNDPLYGAQWGLENRGEDITGFGGMVAGADISAEQAWEIYAKSQGANDEPIIVAVLDEGIDYAHPDLKNRMWVNDGEQFNARVDADGNGYRDDVHGYNFIMDKGIVTSGLDGDTGHGTHVAGIIAAQNNNGEGVASIAGGSSNVKLMSCQIFSGYMAASTLEQAIAVKYAADNGAVVLQCSWGLNSSQASMLLAPSPVGTDEDFILYFGILKEAFDYFIHHASSPNGVVDGGVIVFSAGNESAPLPGYPSNYGDYVCVTGVAADYTPAIYTNYGGNSTIAAPGGDRDYYVHEQGEILSTLPTTISETGYGFMEGTSMATPMVSGVVALGLSHAANNYKHIKARSVKDMLALAGDDIDSYLVGTKPFYFNSAATGSTNSPQLDWINLSKFRGKMGSGLINAAKFLQVIEGADVGAEVKIPNYTVGVEATVSDDISVYFADKGLSFAANVADSSVAEVAVSGSRLTIKGLKQGTTKVTITAGGQSQTITVIVRNLAASGWM